MRIKILMSMLLVLSLLSCKDDKKAAEADKAATETKSETEDPTAIKLSNYSDENWSAGVGITFNMFLTDYSKEKEALIKAGTKLVFEDGTIVPYQGYEVAKDYIRISIAEKSSDYKEIAQYPHVISVQ